MKICHSKIYGNIMSEVSPLYPLDLPITLSNCLNNHILCKIAFIKIACFYMNVEGFLTGLLRIFKFHKQSIKLHFLETNIVVPKVHSIYCTMPNIRRKSKTTNCNIWWNLKKVYYIIMPHVLMDIYWIYGYIGIMITKPIKW